MRRGARSSLLAVMAIALAGCASGGGSPSAPVVARRARLPPAAGSSPRRGIRAGVPVTLSFTVAQPSGAPLVHYRTGPGPHIGVHLIIVRDDLATIIHRHPPIGDERPDPRAGRVPQARARTASWSTSIPQTKGPGLHELPALPTIHVAGAYHPIALPPLSARW